MKIVRNDWRIIIATLPLNVQNLACPRAIDKELTGPRCNFMDPPFLGVTTVVLVFTDSGLIEELGDITTEAGGIKVEVFLSAEGGVQHFAGLSRTDHKVRALSDQVPLLVEAANVVIDDKVALLVAPVIGLGNVQDSSIDLASDDVGGLLGKVEGGELASHGHHKAQCAGGHTLVSRESGIALVVAAWNSVHIIGNIFKIEPVDSL